LRTRDRLRHYCYGDRLGIVLALKQKNKARKIQSIYKIILNMSQHYTRSITKVKSQLKSLESRVKSAMGPIDRKIYKLVCEPALLEIAYNNIKSNPGNMTPGIASETLDGFSHEALTRISNQLKNESFEFKPGRRVNILKENQGIRTLTMAPPRDKIVQEAMKIILEIIYEPHFSDSSHGFRPRKSCHSALKYLDQHFKPITWLIEGDIVQCFDSIDHRKLMLLIEAKILDRQFTKLIRKALSAGYFELKSLSHNIVGTPQGSIISPILANIFLDQLDQFAVRLKKKFDKGNRARDTQAFNRSRHQVRKGALEGNKSKLKQLSVQARKIPAMDFYDPNSKRLSYVRYADDFLIGIRGSYAETLNILEEVKSFCSNIKLTLSEHKTKITNLNKQKAVFLGVNIFRSKHTKVTLRRKPGGNGWYKQRHNRQIQYHVSLDSIRHKLAGSSIFKNGKSHPRFIWLGLEHRQIIHMYNGVFRGFLNYYSFVGNYSRMVSLLQYLIYGSAAKLLATKYKLSVAKVYQKFGAQLGTKNGKSKLMKPSYKCTREFKVNVSPVISSLFASSKSISNLDNLVCKRCGSDYRVEMHHVRALKDLNPHISEVDKIMAKNRRKQIALCRLCHMKKHRREI
jgi:group II intron reverse transcriptase/maturase